MLSTNKGYTSQETMLNCLLFYFNNDVYAYTYTYDVLRCTYTYTYVDVYAYRTETRPAPNTAMGSGTILWNAAIKTVSNIALCHLVSGDVT